MTDITVLVDRYFRLAPSPDTDAYFAQFTEDAIAEDEGHLHRGVDAIRAWRGTVPPVSYSVRSVEPDSGDNHSGDNDSGDNPCGDHDQVAVAEITGDFPGSPVSLSFHFTFTDDGHISSLAIRA